MKSFNLDELANLVGKEFRYNVRGAEFLVTASDARIRYGTLDLLVSPVSGAGSFWVARKSVVLTEVSSARSVPDIDDVIKKLQEVAQ